MKRRRGAPKRIHTEGFACPNHLCPYFGITAVQIHALVGDGKHGQTEQIQTFRCQACHTTFTSRRHTPLYRLKTPSQQIAMVLSALAEGLDPSAASRVFGYRQATITTWLTRAGSHAEILHERSFCNLHLPHLQLDELRTRLLSAKHVLWLVLTQENGEGKLEEVELHPVLATSFESCPKWMLLHEKCTFILFSASQRHLAWDIRSQKTTHFSDGCPK